MQTSTKHKILRIASAISAAGAAFGFSQLDNQQWKALARLLLAIFS